MASEVFALAIQQSVQRNLSVLDLMHAAESLRAAGTPEQIKTLYATWIEHNQDNPLLYAVLFNYAVILSDTGVLDFARECLQRAITLNPDFMPAYINLGRIYERLGAIGPAVQQWSTAIDRLAAVNGAAITHKTTAMNQAARVLESANQDEPAESMLHQSLELDNNQREAVQHFVALRQRQCEWPIISSWERVSRETLMKGLSPLSAAAYTDDPLLQLANAWHYNIADIGDPAIAPVWNAGSLPTPVNGKLRIGYLSSDLREHAVGHLMAEVFGLHDREKVEIFAYYCGPFANDPLHVQFKAAADHFISISEFDDESAARRIAADGIHILVDVNGYTREGRTKLVAMRPAPVIVNWLGYPGTCASPYHQYIIADNVIIPEENEMYYSEKVLRLPCYQPNNRQRIVSDHQPTRAEMGLPDDAMVYCCFNGVHKLTRFTFDRWLTILERVPDSVLWLLSSTEPAQDRLRKYAQLRGIAPERLIFAGKLKNPDHLARYPLADLFLDTTPYGAHTTASDALWMGVPVLTYAGRSFASRVCASLVDAGGTPELICSSAEEYVDRAVEFGVNRDLLMPFRQRLETVRDHSTLFDTPLLVRELETLYQQMWQDYENERLPQPDLTNLDAYLQVGVAVDHEAVEMQTIEDYHGWWREKLMARHRLRPLAADKRLLK